MEPPLSRKVLYGYERRGFKLNDLIQLMQQAYPSLYSRRDRVLHHLFCIIGNGYQWRNGRLVSDRIWPQDNDAEAIRRWRAGDTTPVVSALDKREEEYRKERDARTAEINELLAKYGESPVESSYKKILADREAREKAPLDHCYPLSSYSRMACVPDNVKPDYLAGVREMIEIVLALDPEAAKSNKANIAFALKCKQDLEKRFPTKG